MHQSSKKLVVLALIVVMVGLPSTFRNVAAMGPSGTCYSLASYESPPIGTRYPSYCECEHSAAGWFDDMMAGIGVMGFYTPNTISFSTGAWDFVVEAGRDLWGMDLGLVYAVNSPACIFCVDYDTPTQYYSYYTPQYSCTWDHGYNFFGSWNELGYYSEITDYQALRDLDPARISLEGVTQGTFLMTNEPYWYWYQTAYTHYDPNNNNNLPVEEFAFLTAHETGDWSAIIE